MTTIKGGPPKILHSPMPTNILMEPLQKGRLRQVAFEQGVSQAHVMRNAFSIFWEGYRDRHLFTPDEQLAKGWISEDERDKLNAQLKKDLDAATHEAHVAEVTPEQLPDDSNL